MTTEQRPDREVNRRLLDVQDSMLDGLSQLAAYFGFSKVMGQALRRAAA